MLFHRMDIYFHMFFYLVCKKLHGSTKNLPTGQEHPFTVQDREPRESCVSSEPTEGELLCAPGLASGVGIQELTEQHDWNIPGIEEHC